MRHEMTLTQVLQEQAARRPEHPAVIEPGRTLSYRALETHVFHLASGLIELGVQPGDRVAIWLKNCLDWAALHLAVGSLGAIVVPINTRYKGEEVRYILQQSDACALVAMDSFLGIDFLALVRQLAPGIDAAGPGAPLSADLPELRWVIGHTSQPELLPPGMLPFSELARRGAAAGDATARAWAERVQPADVQMILFTSGTTGFPKGAMLEHRHFVFTAMNLAEAMELGPADRLLVPNPYFHVMGNVLGINMPLWAGSTVVPLATFAAEEVLNLIDRHRVTCFTGTPSMFQMLIEHPRFREVDVSSLRVGLMAGAPGTPAFIQRVIDEMGFEGLTTGLGMTETAGGITNTRLGDPLDLVASTAGRALPGVELRIVDPATGQDVPTGERGELWVRCPSVMRGYFRRPEETRAVLSPDGWYHTADMVTRDEQGNVALVGRLKDMYFCGGFNVYPAEVEIALTRHPAVAEAQVVGVPDRRLGEVGMAFVRLRPDVEATEADLIAFCRERLANFKVPRYLRFVTSYPMTASGKVEKFRLREQGAEVVQGAPPPHPVP